MSTLLILNTLLALVALAASQKALLLSSSIGYYNIRQVNDIVKIYQHLRQNGFRDEDILLHIGQLQPCCEKNHRFGTLSFHDGEYTNIFKGVEVDYYQSQIHAQRVASNIMGFYGAHTLNKKKLSLAAGEPLLIYVTGHGGDFYFKIREREALIDEQFASIFATLGLKNITQKIGLLSDSCSAITPFERVGVDGFLALASSSFAEKSLSHGYDAILNQPKSDDFSYYLDEVLSGKAHANELNSIYDWTFQDLQKYIHFSKVKVNSKLITNKLKPNEKLADFFTRKRPNLVKKKSNKMTMKQFFDS